MSIADQSVFSSPPQKNLLSGEKFSDIQAEHSDTLHSHRLNNQAGLADVKQLNTLLQQSPTAGLPALSLIFSRAVDITKTAGTVAEQLFNGAADEVVHHSDTLLKDAAIGAAAGAAVTFLPALAVPATIVAGYEFFRQRDAIVSAGKEFINDVQVIDDGATRSALDIAKADESLAAFGRVGAELAAGVVGGVAGSAAMRAAIAARAASASVRAMQAEQNALGLASQTGADHVQYTESGLVDEKGIFSNYKFKPIDHSRVLDFKDLWQFDGSKTEVEANLQKAGFQKWNAGLHLGDEEWRLPAKARGSVHFMIGKSLQDAATGVWKTVGNVHGYEYDPGTHILQHFLHDVVRI